MGMTFKVLFNIAKLLLLVALCYIMYQIFQTGVYLLAIPVAVLILLLFVSFIPKSKGPGKAKRNRQILNLSKSNYKLLAKHVNRINRQFGVVDVRNNKNADDIALASTEPQMKMKALMVIAKEKDASMPLYYEYLDIDYDEIERENMAYLDINEDNQVLYQETLSRFIGRNIKRVCRLDEVYGNLANPASPRRRLLDAVQKHIKY